MTPEQQVAYIQSQTMCAQIEAMGMCADNQRAQFYGRVPDWTKEDFDNLINKYGVHHNAVIAEFQR